VTLAAALPGCASVADRISDGGSADRDDPAADAEPRGDASANGSARSEPADESSAPREPIEVSAPDVSFADAPVPDDPSAFSYARMGSGADVTATVFGNWKCPYTRSMVVDYLPEVVSTFVRPGELDLELRFLAYRSGEPFLGADAPRATRAGLAVWDEAPESYWSYFSHVFANQPPSDERWATASALRTFADAADVQSSLDRLDRDDERVDRTVAAAHERSVYSVPRIVVDGEVVAPTLDPDAATDALSAATR